MNALQRGVRSINTTTLNSPRLSKFALHPPKTVEVGFSNGSVFNFSAEYLRIHSPAADGKLWSIGGEKVIFGRRHVGIMSAEPVGNYGVRLIFDDLHKTGIYTWDYFHYLGSSGGGFSDGSVFNFSAECLRIHSPAADGKLRSVGGEKVIFGRHHVGIMSAEPLGNFGVRLVFDVLHKTGISTWDYFHYLGTNKFTLMRNYVKTLKKHGLTRDAPRRK